MSRPVLLVAGGSRGIGAATAKLAAARGYDVAVNYKSNSNAAAGVVKAVEKAGGKAISIQGDMALENDIERVFETASDTDRKSTRLNSSHPSIPLSLHDALPISGGSRGIGAATAKLAAARGYDVAVNYKSNSNAAAGVVKAVEKAGGKAISIQGDMALENDIERVFETASD